MIKVLMDIILIYSSDEYKYKKELIKEYHDKYQSNIAYNWVETRNNYIPIMIFNYRNVKKKSNDYISSLFNIEINTELPRKYFYSND